MSKTSEALLTSQEQTDNVGSMQASGNECRTCGSIYEGDMCYTCCVIRESFEPQSGNEGWIPTSDPRRPEFDAEILVCNEGPQDSSIAHYFGDEQIDFGKASGPWGWCFTHWLPIPPLPQAHKQEGRE